VYIGGEDGSLFAVNPNGRSAGRSSPAAHIHSSPPSARYGTIYVGSGDGRLYAINPDGTEKWYCGTGTAIESSPALGPDGTVVTSRSGLTTASMPSPAPVRWRGRPWPMFRKDLLHTAHITSNDVRHQARVHGLAGVAD